AVLGDVELAADEPFRERQLPFERLRERLVPGHGLAGDLRPEGLRVALRLVVQRSLGVGLRRERRVGREGAAFREEVLDLGTLVDAHVASPAGMCVCAADRGLGPAILRGRRRTAGLVRAGWDRAGPSE